MEKPILWIVEGCLEGQGPDLHRLQKAFDAGEYNELTNLMDVRFWDSNQEEVTDLMYNSKEHPFATAINLNNVFFPFEIVPTDQNQEFYAPFIAGFLMGLSGLKIPARIYIYGINGWRKMLLEKITGEMERYMREHGVNDFFSIPCFTNSFAGVWETITKDYQEAAKSWK